MDDEQSSGNLSILTPDNNARKTNIPKIVKNEVNKSIKYGTPSIQNYFPALRNNLLPPVQVITLDSPEECVNGSTIEIARSEAKDCVVILEHNQKSTIRRCSSINNKHIANLDDTAYKSTPINKSSSLPITPASSGRLIRRITFESPNDKTVLLGSASCRRHLTRDLTSSQSSIDSNDTTLSLKENEVHSIIGAEPLKVATHLIQIQKTFNLFNAWDYCEKDRKFFMGSIYRYVKRNMDSEENQWTYVSNNESSGVGCYQMFFETYTSPTTRGFHTTDEESGDLWLAILDFLEDSCSTEECPNIEIIHAILLRGLRGNQNDNVRQAAFSYIQRLILFQYPPHSTRIRDFYKRLFNRNPGATLYDLNKFDPMEMWDFFWELIEESIQVCCYNNEKNSEPFLLLHLVILLIQSDFISWVDCCLHIQNLDSSLPIITQLFWPGEIGCVNMRLKQIIKAYVSVLCLASPKCELNTRRSSASHVASLIRQIISMLAQLVDLWDKNKEQNTFKQNLVDTFVLCLEDSEKNNARCLPQAVLWTQLYILKPDWFSAAIARSLLVKASRFVVSENRSTTMNDSKTLLLSLRKLTEQIDKIKESTAKMNLPYNISCDQPLNHIVARGLDTKSQIYCKNYAASTDSTGMAENKENFSVSSPTPSLLKISLSNTSILAQTPTKQQSSQSQKYCGHISTFKSAAESLKSPAKINANTRNKYGKLSLNAVNILIRVMF